METILKEINAVLGVIGSFVCSIDGEIVARAMPGKHDTEKLELAARVIIQTSQALEMSGQKIAEADFLYGDGRLIVKNLPGGSLIILCARNINLPLLNLATTNALKKLEIKLKQSVPAVVTPPPSPEPEPKPTPPPTPAPTQASAPPPTPAPAQAPIVETKPAPVQPPIVESGSGAAPSTASADDTLSPLYRELEKETLRLIAMGQSNQVKLVALDPVALWTCCSHTRQMLTPPQKRQIDFVAPSEQESLIVRMFERIGYQANQRFNALHGKQRLNFQEPQRLVNVNIFLDAYEMYHRIDLREILARNENVLTETAVILMHLQVVESIDSDLSELGALFLEHDLTLSGEKGKIDSLWISRLCSQDWGWYKTVTMNLERLREYAEDTLNPVQQDRIVQRVLHLKSNIDATPKSLRWLTRARLGTTVRWYETPLNLQTIAPWREMSLNN
jgi:predicted regulator of Ras-like GTPase activity (Roadblock/LC7/MglB family)